MDDLVKTARRAKDSDLLPKVSFGTMNAETLILRMADRIEELEAEVARLREYYEAVEDVGEPIYSHHQMDRVDAARAALAEQEKDDG
jgi:hypothetical protein